MSENKMFRLEDGTLVTADVAIQTAYRSKRNSEKYLDRKELEHTAMSLDDERNVSALSAAIDIGELTERNMEIENLYAALSRLPEKERTLIYKHYFEDMSLRSLGTEYGVSHTKIGKTINCILDKLREDIINNSD